MFILLSLIIPLLLLIGEYFLTSDVWSVGWLGLGLYFGLVMMWADRWWLYKWYDTPGTHPFVITRSLLFILIFVPLSVFMLTSSGSLIGIGLMLGMGTVVTTEMWGLINRPSDFQVAFMPQSKESVPAQYVRWGVYGFTMFMIFMYAMVVVS